MSDLPETATLPSGARLTLNHPPFSVAMDLVTSVAVELKGVATGLKVELSLGDPVAMIAKLAACDLPVDLLKDALLQAVASPRIRASLHECMGRCLLNGQVCNIMAFEDPKVRGDYFPAAWEVMKFTLSPFFAGLSSKSLVGSAPKSGSQP